MLPKGGLWTLPTITKVATNSYDSTQKLNEVTFVTLLFIIII